MVFAENLLRAVMLGAVSGVAGTGFGGAMAAVWPEPSPRPFAAMVGFSAGMMLAVTLLDLLPGALAAHPAAGVAGSLVGIVSMALVDTVTARDACSGLHTGAVVGLGIAIHNLAEGLAVGSGYMAKPTFGLRIAVLIGLHDVPEGLAMATMLRLGGTSGATAFASSAIAGLPMAAGAFAGALAGAISRAGLALSLGVSGGAMLFITFRMLPEGASLSRWSALLSGVMVGLAAGASLVAVM